MKIINRIIENKILLALVIIGTIVRLYKLQYQSPWGDELFTMINTTTDKSFIEIFQILKNDVHPPLYYYIIHCFNFIFGDTLFSARVVSVLFGICGFLSIYYLGKELINKKIGLIAVALLILNHFHLYHSQEARMYSMLFFTTTISFYYLIKFIKNPTLKSALFHSIFACLMIYTHFFALFTLLSQYLILLYFLIKPYQFSQRNFFLYSLFSGVITAILYIPSLIIFFTASKRDSFWIPIPEKDVYTVMIKEFFGFSEIPLMIALIALLYFFIKLFRRNEVEKFFINPILEKQVFTFFILFIWIVVTLIIPLIISFINLPMIVSRYFINILPALLILIATGLYYIKNELVRLILILSFILFSFADIVYVKAYYRGIMKTQYREVCEYVKEKHITSEPIYSSFEYYMSYYLNAKENHPVLKVTLNEIAAKSLTDSTSVKPFWYLDINGTPDQPSEETKKILDSLYVVDDNITLFDCYAKHYHPKATYKPDVSLSKFKKPYKERNGDNVNFSVEIFKEINDKIEISGWIYFENQSTDNVKINLLLINDKEEIVLSTENVSRGDVTTYFKSKYDLSKSGFKSEIIKKNISDGNYNVAIYIKDEQSKKETLIITDKKVIINKGL